MGARRKQNVFDSMPRMQKANQQHFRRLLIISAPGALNGVQVLRAKATKRASARRL
jgi:hypothetical protein